MSPENFGMITREADYAIRCILFLSRIEGKLTSVKDISGPMGIPPSFLAKILQKLLKSGLVESVRGAGGGFRLKRKPEDINLCDVVEAIDGPVALNRCAVDENICEFSVGCPIHPVWVELRRDVEGVLKKHNFKSLLDMSADR